MWAVLAQVSTRSHPAACGLRLKAGRRAVVLAGRRTLLAIPRVRATFEGSIRSAGLVKACAWFRVPMHSIVEAAEVSCR